MVCKRAVEKWDDLKVCLPSVILFLQSKVNNYKFFREFSFTFFSLFSINSFFKTMFLFLQNELAMWIPVGDFGFFLESILRKHRDRKFRGLPRVREKWEASRRYIQWIGILQVRNTESIFRGFRDDRSSVPTNYRGLELPEWLK